jgi:hypothetical protein
MQLPTYNRPITLDDEIQELEREIKLRQRCYPEWASGPSPRLKPEEGAKRIAAIEKTLARLKAEKAKQGVQTTIF